MNTLQKRTFSDGSFIELYQRKDNSYRIKYTSRDGDEICVNLASKNWALCQPAEIYNDILSIGRSFMDERNVGEGNGDGWYGIHVAAGLIARCSHSVREAASIYGQHPETGQVWDANHLKPETPSATVGLKPLQGLPQDHK